MIYNIVRKMSERMYDHEIPRCKFHAVDSHLHVYWLLNGFHRGSDDFKRSGLEIKIKKERKVESLIC